MIDIENIVYTAVRNALAEFDPEITVSGDHFSDMATYPFVRLYESDNSTATQTWDEQGEHHARVSYIVEVYVNDDTGRKQHAKSIAAVIDAVLLKLGLARSSRDYEFAARRAGQFRSSSTDMTVFAITSVYYGMAGESYSGNADEITIYRR